MFPLLTHRIGTGLLDRLDLLVQFSTLGEYSLGEYSPDHGREAQGARRRRGHCARRRRATHPRSRGDEARS